MCERALFYFGLDLHIGIPEKTCIIDFRDYVHDHVSGFATISILAVIIALILFLVHFTMYCRTDETQQMDAMELPRGSMVQEQNGQYEVEMPGYGGVNGGDQSQGHIPTDDNKVFAQPTTLDKQNEF